MLELEKDNEKGISDAILRFIKSLRYKEFLLTSKQFYKIFVFMAKLSCTRKEFIKGLSILVKDGFLRETSEAEIIYFEINHTRFKMENVFNRD